MKILLTGRDGQLGWELMQSIPPNIELIGLSRSELDISNTGAVLDCIAFHQPKVVINAAAYTAVDKAESDEQQASAVNSSGAHNLAMACKNFNARLLHISTDFVFDGTKTTPYLPDDAVNPLSVYGHTKLAGELAIQAQLNNVVIVRTAWVYSAHGNNFVKTMLRLMAEKPQLGVVTDQVGTPTWAYGLAQWLWAVIDKPHVSGMFHWTDGGVASWYDFAIAIQELALQKGLLKQSIPILPIPSSAYPTPARRPSFSVMNKSSAEKASGITTVHWRKQLAKMLDTLTSSH
jgi:dTDP-4-dehydrorhamnose reductase